MLTVNQIRDLLLLIDKKLAERNQHGHIVLAGGAALALVYGARDQTKDIDAIFEPKGTMREIISEITHESDLSIDWMNDAVKGFIDTTRQRTDQLMQLDNLTVDVVDTKGLLAMKLVAARMDLFDMDDTLTLARHAGVTSLDELYDIVEERMPPSQLTSRSGLFIQEVWDLLSAEHSHDHKPESPANDMARAREQAANQRRNPPLSNSRGRNK